MAHLAKKNCVYLARFRYEGREYKRSLRTTDVEKTRAATRQIENTIHWLKIGHLIIPDGVESADFLLRGGKVLQEDGKKIKTIPTLSAAIAEYLQRLNHLAESNRGTIGVHLRNLQRKL